MFKSARNSEKVSKSGEVHDLELPKHQFSKLLLNKPKLEDKTRVYLKLRKRLSYIQEVSLTTGDHNASTKFPFFRKGRSSTDMTIFRALSKAMIKGKIEFKQVCFFRGKKILKQIKANLNKSYVSYSVSKMLISSISPLIRNFQVKQQLNSTWKLELLLFLRNISRYANLETLKLDLGIESASFSSFTMSQSHRFKSYILRFKKLRNFDFGKTWPIHAKTSYLLCEIISRLPNLREFHPKLLFLSETSPTEKELLKIISNSHSLQELNFLITNMTDSTSREFGQSIANFQNIRIMRAGIQVSSALKTFLASSTAWINLKELHLESKFFRTSLVDLDPFQNLAQLSKLQKCTILFENKRNNQPFIQVWNNLSKLLELQEFTLCFKHFKLTKEDEEALADLLAGWPKIQKVFFKFSDIEYQLTKSLFTSLNRGLNQASDSLITLRIRLPYSCQSFPGLLFSDLKRKNLKKFEYSGATGLSDKEGIMSIAKFIQQNGDLRKLRVALNDEKKKKYHMPPPEDCAITKHQLESLMKVLQGSNILKLKMIIGRMKHDQSGFSNIIYDTLKNMEKLRCLQLDFGQSYLSNSEAKNILKMIEDGIFRKVNLKESSKSLAHTVKASILKLNKQFKTEKESEGESKIEKLEKYDYVV